MHLEPRSDDKCCFAAAQRGPDAFVIMNLVTMLILIQYLLRNAIIVLVILTMKDVSLRDNFCHGFQKAKRTVITRHLRFPMLLSAFVRCSRSLTAKKDMSFFNHVAHEPMPEGSDTSSMRRQGPKMRYVYVTTPTFNMYAHRQIYI